MKRKRVLLVCLLVFISFLTSLADDKITYSYDTDNMLMKVYLQKEVALEGYQCDIILPSGLSVAEQGKGIVSSLDGFNIRYKIIEKEHSTKVRILCYSETTDPILYSKEREICIIPIVRTPDFDDSAYVVSFGNSYMSVNQGTSVSMENKDFLTIREELADITYTRDFSNTSWQALYVPFSMNYDDWKDDFDVASISGVHQNDDNANKTYVVFSMMKDGERTEPNKPCFIRSKSVGEKTISLDNAVLEETKEKTYSIESGDVNFNFTGTYHTVSDMFSKEYYAMSDGALKKASSDAVSLHPFRWYLSVTDRDGNVVTLRTKEMNIVSVDSVTNVDVINNVGIEDTSAVYSLTGIRKNTGKPLSPGIYIKKGKKYVVK